MSELRPGDSPNRHLINLEGSRQQLNTPALVLDLDVLEQNINSMSAHARSSGTGLRPHSKSHKSINIASLQVKAGALGVCCANIGEAEVMVHHDISDILITSPVVTAEKISRLCAITGEQSDIKVVVDNSRNVTNLDHAASSANKTLGIIVDIESGARRTGVTSSDLAVDLVRQVESSAGLNYRGLQCYAGHVQHISEHDDREKQCLESMALLQVILQELGDRGIASEIITGGGTGTFEIDMKAGIFTDVQVGSYIFMDSQYRAVWKADAIPFPTSLFVQMTVNSSNHDGFATVDAGLKHFSFDGGAPFLVSGVPTEASYQFTGDEHGCITMPVHAEPLSIGARIEAMVAHCDPTVNLYRHYHCVRGDTLVDIWDVDARGAY